MPGFSAAPGSHWRAALAMNASFVLCVEPASAATFGNAMCLCIVPLPSVILINVATEITKNEPPSTALME
eukprot:3624260-Amphidinium_carterae.1